MSKSKEGSLNITGREQTGPAVTRPALAKNPAEIGMIVRQARKERIGGQYRSDWVLKDNWERLAEEAGVGGKAVLDLCRELGEKAPAAAQPLAASFAAGHGAKETINKIAKNVSSMAKKMLEALKR